VASCTPKPKFAKLLVSESPWRAEVKFEEVGSRRGLFVFEMEPAPAAELREMGKKDAGEESVYCCTACGCARERFRAGETPELRACGMLEELLSAHEGRLGRHSVSESATREPDPVLPSVVS